MLSQPLWPPRATGITWSKVSWEGAKRRPQYWQRMVVAGVDVGAGERHVGEGTFHPDVTEQAKHRRQLHPDRDAADLPIVDGDDLDLALEEEGHGLLPGNDPQRLVGRVEDEGLFHGGTDAKIVRLGPETVKTLGRLAVRALSRGPAPPAPGARTPRAFSVTQPGVAVRGSPPVSTRSAPTPSAARPGLDEVGGRLHRDAAGRDRSRPGAAGP